MRKICFLIALIALGGCSTLRPPIIEDRVGLVGREVVGTLATAADYRVVIVPLEPVKDEKGEKRIMFCAEPSADAASQISAAFSALLAAPLLKGKEIDAQAAAAIATSMKQLFKRSQGVQLYRDGQFTLCNAFLNGAIGKQQYFEELQKLRESAQALIHEEIPYLMYYSFDPTPTPKLPEPPPLPKPSEKSDSGKRF